MAKGLGSTQKKILLLLSAGIALGLTGSPRRQFAVARELAHEWRAINRSNLKRSIASLYESKIVEEKRHADGTITLILTKKGKRQALRFNVEKMKVVTPKRWDGKWRIVIYDIPERLRRLRGELHAQLHMLGFHELQHSVFVHPFPCEKEIEFLVELYDARKYVRFIVADSIDNEFHLRTRYSLAQKI